MSILPPLGSEVARRGARTWHPGARRGRVRRTGGAAGGAQSHGCRPRGGAAGAVGGEGSGRRAHLSGGRVSDALGGRHRAAHPRLPRARGSRDQGVTGQGGAGRPRSARPWRLVLRPAAIRGEGSGVSRGPLHPAIADAGDHHRGWCGVRSGAAQTRHRSTLAGPAGRVGGGARGGDRGAVVARGLPQRHRPIAAGTEPVSVAVRRPGGCGRGPAGGSGSAGLGGAASLPPGVAG